MTERRMDAYYYQFELTGVEAVDKILGAVACAGKAYHHTRDWCDEAYAYDDHTGESPKEWIQNAAKEAASRIEKLESALQIYSCDCSLASEEEDCELGDWTMLSCGYRARKALEGKDE